MTIPSQTLALPAALVAGDADAVRRQWLDQCPAGSLTVDASQLEAIDTAGLQMLVALRRHVEAGGGHLIVQSAPTVLREAVRLAGLPDALPALPEAPPEAPGHRPGTP